MDGAGEGVVLDAGGAAGGGVAEAEAEGGAGEGEAEGGFEIEEGVGGAGVDGEELLGAVEALLGGNPSSDGGIVLRQRLWLAEARSA